MNIAIIDDLYDDIERLIHHIKRYFVVNNIISPLKINSFINEKEFLNLFAKNKYDLIFIDYYLKLNNGLKIK